MHPPASQGLIENIYICMRITERDILYTGILSELSKIDVLPVLPPAQGNDGIFDRLRRELGLSR